MKFKKILFSLIALSSLNLLLGQAAKNDTVFIKKSVQTERIEIDTIIVKNGISPVKTEVLVGTRFLPYTDKMIGLLNNGLSAISLEVIQQCDGKTDPRTFGDYPKFVEIKRDTNELTMDVSVVANCCHNFLGEAEVVGKDTLNLIYTSYGGFCSCNCCYTLRYKFNTIMEKNFQVLKFVTINQSEVTGRIPNK